MAAIGAFTVTAWPAGRLDPGHTEVGKIDPLPGIDGNAWVLGAQRTELSVVQTAADISADKAASLLVRDGYLELETTFVTVVDSIGETWTNVFVKRVHPELSWNGATGKWRLYAAWQLNTDTP